MQNEPVQRVGVAHRAAALLATLRAEEPSICPLRIGRGDEANGGEQIRHAAHMLGNQEGAPMCDELC